MVPAAHHSTLIAHCSLLTVPPSGDERRRRGPDSSTTALFPERRCDPERCGPGVLAVAGRSAPGARANPSSASRRWGKQNGKGRGNQGTPAWVCGPVRPHARRERLSLPHRQHDQFVAIGGPPTVVRPELPYCRLRHCRHPFLFRAACRVPSFANRFLLAAPFLTEISLRARHAASIRKIT
jgi:hypothetical protein